MYFERHQPTARQHPKPTRQPARELSVSKTAVIDLQRAIGNRAVAGLVVQRRPRTRRAAVAPTTAELRARQVTAEVTARRFADGEQQLPAGVFGPPRPGGAYWLLNGLSPADLVTVLGKCDKSVRQELLAHISEADGRYDRPRLESAMRSAAWGEQASGVAGLELLDAIRNVGRGSFAPVWATLVGLNRVTLIARLRTLDRATLSSLQSHLAEAPPAQASVFTEVTTDLLGAGTNMQAADVIDLAGLRGLQREMARIYNLRGQFILERANDLGISTHAAAGIMKAESGGATFSETTDKTIIRFENHVFWDRWGHTNTAQFRDHFRFAQPPDKRWHGHEFRDATTDPWRTFHGNQEAEWEAITLAARLAGEATAFDCASWGAGQIMGFNAGRVGFASSVELARSYNASERSQISGIFEFIRANHLETAIRTDDYLTLATRYNGSGQAANYAANISANATAYQLVTAGKLHVAP